MDSPVSLDEYLDAIVKIEKGKPVENPHIMVMPDMPQQIMTIGLVLDLIFCFMTKYIIVDYFLLSIMVKYGESGYTIFFVIIWVAGDSGRMEFT